MADPRTEHEHRVEQAAARAQQHPIMREVVDADGLTWGERYDLITSPHAAPATSRWQRCGWGDDECPDQQAGRHDADRWHLVPWRLDLWTAPHMFRVSSGRPGSTGHFERLLIGDEPPEVDVPPPDPHRQDVIPVDQLRAALANGQPIPEAWLPRLLDAAEWAQREAEAREQRRLIEGGW